MRSHTLAKMLLDMPDCDVKAYSFNDYGGEDDYSIGDVDFSDGFCVLSENNWSSEQWRPETPEQYAKRAEYEATPEYKMRQKMMGSFVSAMFTRDTLWGKIGELKNQGSPIKIRKPV